MPMNKRGSNVKIDVVKQAGFTLDENYIAAQMEKQWPTKKVSMDQLHTALKSIGVVNYSSEDMSALIGRLESVGFKVTR